MLSTILLLTLLRLQPTVSLPTIGSASFVIDYFLVGKKIDFNLSYLSIGIKSLGVTLLPDFSGYPVNGTVEIDSERGLVYGIWWAEGDSESNTSVIPTTCSVVFPGVKKIKAIRFYDKSGSMVDSHSYPPAAPTVVSILKVGDSVFKVSPLETRIVCSDDNGLSWGVYFDRSKSGVITIRSYRNKPDFVIFACAGMGSEVFTAVYPNSFRLDVDANVVGGASIRPAGIPK